MKSLKNPGLMMKFLLPLLLLMIVALGITTMLSYQRSRAALEDAIIDRLEKVAESAMVGLDSWVQRTLLDMQIWSRETVLIDCIPDTFLGESARGFASQHMADLKAEYGFYETLFLVNPQGTVLAESDPNFTAALDLTGYSFFQEALEGAVVLAPAQQSPVTGQPIVIMAIPVMADQTVQAVLIGGIRLASYAEEQLAASIIGQNGSSFLFSDTGDILFHPDPTHIFKTSVHDLEFGAAMTAAPAGTVQYVWNGMDTIAAFRHYAPIGCTLVISAGTRELFAPARTIRNANLLVAIVMVGIAGGVIVVIVRSIVTPINTIVRELTEAITLGDFDREITIHRQDEIGELAEAFRTMNAKIARVLQEMERVFQGIRNGDLTIRGKSDQFKGGWHALADGVNNIVDAFTEPISTTAEVLRQISRGTIPARVRTTYQGDFRAIQEDLNTMIATLGTFVTDVRNAAEQVAAGSRDLNKAAEQMSEGSSLQATSAEEVSSTMEQMAANIRQNAENALQTEKIAIQSAENAQKGGKAVAQTVTAITEIAKTIKVIEEIAQQTHMLSLNATIEASKAQDHGKGFAVVASEVRALAERSRCSAESITDLAGSSMTIAQEAREVLHELVPDIERTSSLVQEISAASNEQKTGADQINDAIQQLDQVIQHNAMLAEETAAASEQFSKQAEHLRKTVAAFHVIAPEPSEPDEWGRMLQSLEQLPEQDARAKLLSAVSMLTRLASRLDPEDSTDRAEAAPEPASAPHRTAAGSSKRSKEPGQDSLDEEFEHF